MKVSVLTSIFDSLKMVVFVQKYEHECGFQDFKCTVELDPFTIEVDGYYFGNYSKAEEETNTKGGYDLERVYIEGLEITNGSGDGLDLDKDDDRFLCQKIEAEILRKNK